MQIDGNQNELIQRSKAGPRWAAGLESTLILIVVVLASALAMSPSLADPDLWGHVQFGRDILHSGEVPETTTYSFTADGFRWINHENLSEIVMALAVDSMGPMGLILGKFCLALLVILILVGYNLRQGTGLVVTCLITLLVAWNLGYHWSFRPQIASFVFYALLIALLQMSFVSWRDRWWLPWKWTRSARRGAAAETLDCEAQRWRMLWFVPLLFFVWANAHGGYVAGLCIFFTYLGARAFEALMAGGRGRFGWVLHLACLASVTGLVTLLNPYFHRLPFWLIESLGNPRPEINDWSTDQLFSLMGLKFWALSGVAVAALFASRKSLDLTQMLILGITLWQAISHFRHVPFFAILCGFWIGPHLESTLQRIKVFVAAPCPLPQTDSFRRLKAFVLCCLIATMGISLSHRLDRIRVYRDVFPVDAFSFINQNELRGRMVVTYDWAQYAIGAFCVPDSAGSDCSRIGFDGRFRTCYPQPIVDMHFDFLFGEKIPRHRSVKSPACDPGRVLSYRQPDLVILRRRFELSERHMGPFKSEWALLYQDGLAQVWGRKTVFDDPKRLRYLSPKKRVIVNSTPKGYAEWPAIIKTPRTNKKNHQGLVQIFH